MATDVKRLLQHKTALIAAAAVLFVIGAVTVWALGVDPRKQPRRALTTYINALAAGDGSNAASLAVSDTEIKVLKAESREIHAWGSLRGMEVSDCERLERGHGVVWYMSGVLSFAHGRTEFEARLSQVGSELKVRDLLLASVPPGLPDEETPQQVAATGPSTAPAIAASPRAQFNYTGPPAMSIDVAKSYSVVIQTLRGPITLDLFPKQAPITVNNFVFLARAGYYDGLRFHRVISNFMAQGGDPTGTGAGGPGYQFADETDATANPHTFAAPGVLAMANAGPNTNGSQFFITTKATPWLDGRHTIFGQVHGIVDQGVVNALRPGDVMQRITVEESPVEK